ncbi:Translation initiation factor eIF-4E [uncultured virus]|nr:Translation initiation factor eIF-4E [uncultured virus]
MNNRAKSIPYPPRFKDAAPREYTKKYPKKYSKEEPREHPKKEPREQPRENPKSPREGRRVEPSEAGNSAPRTANGVGNSAPRTANGVGNSAPRTGSTSSSSDVQRTEKPIEYPKESFMDTFDYLLVPEVEACMESDTPGLEYPLKSTWVFWVVKVEGKDPVPIYRFSTIGGFWYLINELDFDQDMRCFFMRAGATPRWECIFHKNGAYWIVSVDENNEQPEVDFTGFYTDCLMAMVGENLFMETDRNNTITGITCICGPKLRQIRYWTSDRSSPPIPAQLTPVYRATIEINAKFINFLPFGMLKGKPHRGGKKFRARRTDS